MNNIICHECGTENEPQYIYCKNCGASLRPDTVNNNTQYAQGQNYNSEYNVNNSNQNTYNRTVILDTIDGVPSEDMAGLCR